MMLAQVRIIMQKLTKGHRTGHTQKQCRLPEPIRNIENPELGKIYYYEENDTKYYWMFLKTKEKSKDNTFINIFM